MFPNASKLSFRGPDYQIDMLVMRSPITETAKQARDARKAMNLARISYPQGVSDHELVEFYNEPETQEVMRASPYMGRH